MCTVTSVITWRVARPLPNLPYEFRDFALRVWLHSKLIGNDGVFQEVSISFSILRLLPPCLHDVRVCVVDPGVQNGYADWWDAFIKRTVKVALPEVV
jgi:hypothetical protein